MQTNDTENQPEELASEAAEPVGELVPEEAIDELVAKVRSEGPELLGEGGVIAELTKKLLERALSEELTDHLGYEWGDPAGRGSGNSRNGATPKRVHPEIGTVDLEVPRNRAGSFEPRIVPKGTTRLRRFNESIVALYAQGMSTRDIKRTLHRLYGVEVSPDLISRVTDGVTEELRKWQHRLLDTVYPILYIDALVIKVRTSGTLVNRPSYLALGVDLEGRKQVARELKPIYTAINQEAAPEALDTFELEHGDRHPAIVALWRSSWERFTPFLAYPAVIRKIVYTTNLLESVNYQLRKASKTRGHFPDDNSALKLLRLIARDITTRRGGDAGTGTIGWNQVINALAIHFPDRLSLT